MTINTPADEPVEATPAAQAHAEETGVDLATVEGTGADGKVTKPDVVAAAAELPVLSSVVQAHVDSEVNEGRMTTWNWRHAALDIADEFNEDFHDVENYARKVLHSMGAAL